MLRRWWKGSSLLDDGMLACLDCRLPMRTVWSATTFVPTTVFCYSGRPEGLHCAVDTAKHLQRNVSLTVAGLNIVSSCGLDTYIDISITRILLFTFAFTMPVSVLYMMADKSMRPDAGNGTIFGVTTAFKSMRFNYGVYIAQSE